MKCASLVSAHQKGACMSPRKSLSETSLSARRKRAVFKAFALSLLILFLVSLLDRPEGYVERFIPYAFVQSPSRVYRHDEIDEGKDYNVISVYAVSADADGEGFLRFLETSADWNPLPLTSDMLAQPLLAERFDTHIDDMLACSDGYWHWDSKFHDLMVYDAQTCLLYIRRCSFL